MPSKQKNYVTITGNLVDDVKEVNQHLFCKLAVNEEFGDKIKTITTFIDVAIFNEKLIVKAKDTLKKGDFVNFEGRLVNKKDENNHTILGFSTQNFTLLKKEAEA